jgi:glyoxylase-like metal-dependent hydrolase (beta-lactamase superfamily II)
LIDSGYSTIGKRLENVAEKLGGGKVTYIINTHMDLDHAHGNSFFSDNVTLINYPLLKELVSVGILDRRKGSDEQGVCFAEYYQLDIGTEKVFLFPVPGWHTFSDLLIYFPDSKAAFIGDCVTSLHLKRGNESDQDYQNRISRFKNMEGFMLHVEYARKMIDSFPENTVFVRGHGDNINMEDVRAFYESAHAAMKK